MSLESMPPRETGLKYSSTTMERNINFENILRGSPYNIIHFQEAPNTLRDKKREQRIADSSIFTTEYWKADQYKESVMINFFISTPLSLISYSTSLIDCFHGKVSLFLLYINMWFSVVTISNLVIYYVMLYKLHRTYHDVDKFKLFSGRTIISHVYILGVFVVHIINETRVAVLGDLRLHMYFTENKNTPTGNLFSIIPKITSPIYTLYDVCFTYILLGVTIIILSYTENKYKFITEDISKRLNMMRYVIARILAVFIPMCVLSLSRGVDTLQNTLYKLLHLMINGTIYGFIAGFIINSTYGTFLPWKYTEIEQERKRKMKEFSQVVLFLVSFVLAVGSTSLIFGHSV
ncbi:uncharacterized protein NEPG_01511 [Nematocida parisii ERTm1]|uniref:Uncharacterized protein n=1 Tax=Nematocida parisii (strain ERTm3) TaxID=935791 RepID=I3EDJ8_NEMP3|nr:uncharacterized protein NEPG_01511 [Nematocida parisii ERTm1]EIJ87295.1 hypothetical protein NEQG_02418 [Nematocida parisii ERTm3]EIJ93939.1 hypothetical protein NEPG_01511 [Nematocida parisii ERTm1]KAI5144445.1 hypothetical protein NEPAR04_2087 [Nematocida parisii]|eukprot:XP_013059339.1 hypothetical protein NEPG_01511 [Nematocida parisii ERTm1]